MARKKPLPYAVVTQAVKGDPEAMDKVLTHYRGFIRWLAKRDYMDRDNVSPFPKVKDTTTIPR